MTRTPRPGRWRYCDAKDKNLSTRGQLHPLGCFRQTAEHGGRKISHEKPGRCMPSAGHEERHPLDGAPGSCTSTTRRVSGSSGSGMIGEGFPSRSWPRSQLAWCSNNPRRLALSSPPVGGASGGGASMHSPKAEHMGIAAAANATSGQNPPMANRQTKHHRSQMACCLAKCLEPRFPVLMDSKRVPSITRIEVDTIPGMRPQGAVGAKSWRVAPLEPRRVGRPRRDLGHRSATPSDQKLVCG